MRETLTTVVKRGLGRYGYELRRIDDGPKIDFGGEFPPDFDDATKEMIRFVGEYTMTGPERLSALRAAVCHIVRHHIPGAVVECGVWKGGSMMAVARTLLELGDQSRELYLFDTFEGMPEPTEHDVDLAGSSAFDQWNSTRRSRFTPREARAGLKEVQEAMAKVGYDAERTNYVKGMVEDTIPSRAPDEIAILRLDTDYYESTRHEIFELYPRLVPGGVLIIDDYGHFRGSARAVDEFMEASGEPLLLHRIDYSARVAVKPNLPSR
jgi:hypothetical protein